MYVCMYVTLRNVTLQECGIGCGYIRLIFITSKLIYYWHNYAEKKSYVAIHNYIYVAGASLGRLYCS